MTKDEVRNMAKDWLKKGVVKGVIGLKAHNGNVAPHLFLKAEEVDSLVLSPKYPLSTVCRKIQSKHPDIKLGIVAFGCDERALIELAKREQVNLKNIEILGVACSEADAKECRCERPYPKQLKIGEKVEGVKDERIDKLLKMNPEKVFDFWKRQFNKCMKCYGCRNVCPVCFCKDCELEQDIAVKGGRIPPDFPTFHLIRAFHTAGTCIACGQCEKTCPMHIPLTILYSMLRKDVKELFDYESGQDVDQKLPLNTTFEESPIKEETV
ncbi:MAG: hypothetical protein ABIH76_07705 [Candidatus Bathyarchaeota archaeon]